MSDFPCATMQIGIAHDARVRVRVRIRRRVRSLLAPALLGQHAPSQFALGPGGRTPARLHTEEDPAQHAADIRIDNCNTLAEGEAQHGGGRVVAHAGQGHQLLIRMGQLVGVFLGHHTGALLQSQRPPRIAKPSPGGDHLGGGGDGERRRVRPDGHPGLPIRHHTAHLRLLAHHLGDHHAPWRGTAESPRQVARVQFPPRGQMTACRRGADPQPLFTFDFFRHSTIVHDTPPTTPCVRFPGRNTA